MDNKTDVPRKFSLGGSVYFFFQQEIKEGKIVGVYFSCDNPTCQYEVEVANEDGLRVYLPEEQLFVSKKEAIKELLKKNDIPYKGFCQWLDGIDSVE